MKTILIPISNSFFIRNIMRTDAVRVLLADKSVRLVLLAPRAKRSYYEREFIHARIVFDDLPDLVRRRQERFFKAVETASIHTRTVAMLHRWDVRRGGGRMGVPRRFAQFLFRRAAWQLGRFRWWRSAIRGVFGIIPCRDCADILDIYKPDLVFCPTLLYGETLLIKEAKKRGIATAGMVLSWDNFYSKTLLRVHPELLLVNTQKIRNAAIRYGDFPSERVVVVGIPQYDRSFKKTGVMARDQFIRGLGGDPSKRLVVYALSGKAGLSVDFDILDILARAIKNNKILERVQVLVRPYPRYDFSFEKLHQIKSEYGFLAESVMAHVGGDRDDWEFDDQSLSLLINTLAHADVVITMYSTFFIEGAIFDKPLIGVAFDGYKKFDYFNSARRFFDWDHLSEIKPLGGIALVYSYTELIAAVNECLAHPEIGHDKRRIMVADQCGFIDGKSGERVAEAMLRMIDEVGKPRL